MTRAAAARSAQLAELPIDTLYVASTKDRVQEVNDAKVQQGIATGQPAVHIWARFTGVTGKKGAASGKKRRVHQPASKPADGDEDMQVVHDLDETDASQLSQAELTGLFQVADPHEDKFELQRHLHLCVGARVVLTHNLCIGAGLVNGAIGTVTGFVYQGGDDHTPPSALSKVLPQVCTTLQDAVREQPAIPLVLVRFDPPPHHMARVRTRMRL